MHRSFIYSLALAFALAGSIAQAQGPTYSLGDTQELLDPTFYAGQPEDGSDVAGRTLLDPTVSPDGTKVAFLVLNPAALASSVFVVDVGTSTSWRRITPDVPGVPDFYPAFTPDGSRILYSSGMYEVATGALVQDPMDYFGETLRREATATRLPSDNFLVMRIASDPTDQLLAVPILPSGDPDTDRASEVTIIADVTDMNGNPNGPQLNADGTALAFYNFTDIDPPPGPDVSDIYVMTDLLNIISAEKATSGDPRLSSIAITSLADPRIKPIRTSESPNVAVNGSLTQDSSLVIFAEDQNNIFDDDQFFPTVAAGNWDVFISNADGSGADFQLAEPGNQLVGGVFPSGVRITYFAQVGPDPTYLRLFATSIETANPVPGVDLGNNDIQTTDTLVSNDGSGTAVVVPPNTVVNFPDGEPQEIQIQTPINPVAEAQLPPDASVDAIPVVRDFGPDGTTFAPPIAITISYTDAEIAGLVEASLSPYLFNESTGVFDIPVLEEDIVERNLIDNYITFEVDHFSVYGLGAQEVVLRVGPWKEYR